MSQHWRDYLQGRQEALVESDLWRARRTLDAPQGVFVKHNGVRLNNFSSNDYLGLASNRILANSVVDAVERWGVGSGASHLVCGHQTLHEDLEDALADFVGAERALLFGSGYMANLALATSFAGKGDLILQDRLNHASLIDGAKLSAATFKRYRHSDPSHAEALIKRSEHDGAIIMTDGVFSMDGDQAPLASLKCLADRHQALLFVDDAHGFGCLGSSGAGALELHGLSPVGNVLLMGTLGKAVGSYGAFVAGDAIYIEQLIQSARSYIYTTALPPSVVAASLGSLGLIKQEGDKLRAMLRDRIQQFSLGVSGGGLRLLPSETAIQPILVGDESIALAIGGELESRGYLVGVIRPPTVPKGTARLRITLSASHSAEQVDGLIDALHKVVNG